jgi:hypothetical protein
VHNREETTEKKRQNGIHNQGTSELQKVPNLQDTTNSFGGLQTLKFQKRMFSLLNKSLVVFKRIFGEKHLFFRRRIRLTIYEM